MNLYILIFYVSNSIADYLVVHHWDCTGPDYRLCNDGDTIVISQIEQRILRVQVTGINIKQSHDSSSILYI